MTGHAAQVHVLFLFILFIWFFNQCFSVSQEVFLFLFFLFFSFPFFFLFFFMRFRLKDLTMWLKECWKHCLAVCWISFPLVSHMEQLPLDFSYMIFLLIRTKNRNTKYQRADCLEIKFNMQATKSVWKHFGCRNAALYLHCSFAVKPWPFLTMDTLLLLQRYFLGLFLHKTRFI